MDLQLVAELLWGAKKHVEAPKWLLALDDRELVLPVPSVFLAELLHDERIAQNTAEELRLLLLQHSRGHKHDTWGSKVLDCRSSHHRFATACWEDNECVLAPMGDLADGVTLVRSQVAAAAAAAAAGCGG